MDSIFEVKKIQIPLCKKIILGYAPHFCDSQSFFFSPIPLKDVNQINYEVGTEEGVLLLLAHHLCSNPSTKLQKIFDEIDLGYLSAESNVGEEELEELFGFIRQEEIALILTQDFLSHSRNQSIMAIFEEIANSTHIHCLLDAFTPTPCTFLPEYNGSVARITQGQPLLKGSKQFALFAKIQNGETYTISFADSSIQAPFVLDENMKGTIAILQIPAPFHFYPYQRIQIK